MQNIFELLKTKNRWAGPRALWLS